MASKDFDYEENQTPGEIPVEELIQFNTTPNVPMTTKKLFTANKGWLDEDETYTIASPTYLERLQQTQMEERDLERRTLEITRIRRKLANDLGLDLAGLNEPTVKKHSFDLSATHKLVDEEFERSKRKYLQKMRSKHYERHPPKIMKREVHSMPCSSHSTPIFSDHRPIFKLSESTIYPDDYDDEEQEISDHAFIISVLQADRSHMINPLDNQSSDENNGDNGVNNGAKDEFDLKRMKGLLSEAYLIQAYRGIENSLENFESDIKTTSDICKWSNAQKTYVAKQKLAGEALKFKSTSKELRDAARLKAIGYKLAEMSEGKGADGAADQHMLTAFLNNMYNFHIRLAVVKKEPKDIGEAVEYAMKEEQFASIAKPPRKNYNSSLIPVDEEQEEGRDDIQAIEDKFKDMVNIALQTMEKKNKTNLDSWNKQADELNKQADELKQNNQQMRQEFEKRFDQKVQNDQAQGGAKSNQNQGSRFSQNNQSNRPNYDANIECYGCGRKGHRRRDCNICTYCKKGPHKAEDCRTRIYNEKNGIRPFINRTNGGRGRQDEHSTATSQQDQWQNAQSTRHPNAPPPPVWPNPPGWPSSSGWPNPSGYPNPPGWQNPPDWQNYPNWQQQPKWQNLPNHQQYQTDNDERMQGNMPSSQAKLPIEYANSNQTKNNNS